GVRVPLQVQITLDTTGKMLFGTDIDSALTTLEALPIDVIGMNCSTGPEYMREPIRYLIDHSSLPISVLPNAGLPINVDGEAVYPMEPDPFSDMVAEFASWGVNVVGGCCGTTPEHLSLLYRKVHGHPFEALLSSTGADVQETHFVRRRPKKRTPQREAKASSNMKATPMVQNPAPTMIGERVNSQGSRKVK